MAVYFDIDQAGWGAQKRFADGELLGIWRPDKWIIHYGGNASPAALDPTKETWALRVYEQSHLSRGWRAIGYNYAVGNSGTIYRLRGENISGATSGDEDKDGVPENNEARAVLWLGGGLQVPSPAAEDAMAKIINSDPLPRVIVHSDVKGNTACPGPYWKQWVKDEKYKEDGMPYEQFKNMVISLFNGRPDMFKGDPAYFYKNLPEGIYNDPQNIDWTNFWTSFTKAISNK